MSIAGEFPVEGGGRGPSYAPPWQKIASTFLPSSMFELYRLMEFIYVSTPEVHRIINDLATFPITELSIDDEDEDAAKTYRELLGDTLNIRSFCQGIGLDCLAFGAGYATVLFPFKKTMTCNTCHDTQRMEAWQWKLRSKKYVGKCTKCGTEGEVSVIERKINDKSRIKLVRWPPRDIRIRKNPVTESCEYRYVPPRKVVDRVLSGDRFTHETTPQVIVDAILHGKQIVILDDNFFVMSSVAPSLQMTEDGHGLPSVVCVLNVLHYMDTLRRGSEAVAKDHIAPLRWLSPAANAGQSPADMIDLARFKEEVLGSVQEWRKDPNLVMALPFPINAQNFGGDANAMFVSTEIELSRRVVASGMGVPVEFLDGTLNWSASSVSLRVLGNRVLDHMRDQNRFLRFVCDKVGLFLGLKRVDKVGFVDFKMNDDPQRIQVLAMLQANGLLTGEILVREAIGKELDDMLPVIAEEQEKLDNLQAERLMRQSIAQAIAQARATIEGQKVLAAEGMAIPAGGNAEGGGEEGAAHGEEQSAQGGDDAYAYALRISRMPQQERDRAMAAMLESGQALLAQRVQAYLPQVSSGVDMRPLPQQKPPRRDSMNSGM